MIRLGVLFATFSLCALAETPPRSLAVLLTTDSSNLGIASRVQNQLAETFAGTGLFSPQTYPFSLSSYAVDAVGAAHAKTKKELIAFAYVDQQRIALFLFDVNRPGKYLATAESLSESPTNRLSDRWIDLKFIAAFKKLMHQYSLAAFEVVPGNEQTAAPAEIPLSRAQRARRLFGELSQLQEGPAYLGATLGVARFAADGAAASTVSVGGYGGLRLTDTFQMELGADIFTYFLLHLEGRFQIPLAEKYISLSLGAGTSFVAAVFSQNRGFNPTSISTGQFLFGPSLSLDVPLLGAGVRGDVRVLMGNATIVLVNYGLIYSL